MPTATVQNEIIKDAVSLACRAPSLHTTANLGGGCRAMAHCNCSSTRPG